MAKALTVELFLGVLAIAALDACTSREKTSAEPAPAASAPAALATTTTAAPEDDAPPSGGVALPTTPAPVARTATLVDAGVERKRKDAPARATPGAQAACGAGGCSADMKKGTK